MSLAAATIACFFLAKRAVAAPLRSTVSGVVAMLLEDLEQSRCAHAAADAHRHDAVLRAAPLAFDQQMAGHARAGHAVRMADRDRAARDVELVVRNAELVADVQHLA